MCTLSCRELIHWRGEPDPFKGDVPNARVREFSKDVVEVLFNSAPITNTNNTLAAQVCGHCLLCMKGWSDVQTTFHRMLSYFNSAPITSTINTLAA